MSDEWTQAHKVEAHAITFELCAKAARRQDRKCMEWLLCSSRMTEKNWADDLRHAGFDKATIKRQIKKVKKLVSGEWVRETIWLVGDRICHGGEMKARMISDQTGEMVTSRTRVGRPRKE